MTSPGRVDAPTFSGCFAYLEADIPAELTLTAWRSPPTTSGHSPAQTARPGIAPRGRVRGASAAHRARAQPEEEEPMSDAHLIELVGDQLAGRRERRAALRRLGREARLAAYRRGELDFDTCCLWASRYPNEVPLLDGEFEFIAITTPEVCE
jgi:hypothetical protein